MRIPLLEGLEEVKSRQPCLDGWKLANNVSPCFNWERKIHGTTEQCEFQFVKLCGEFCFSIGDSGDDLLI